MGFTMSEEDALAMIAADPANADVVRPFVNGKDLNGSPDCVGGRWIVWFRDWSQERVFAFREPIRHLALHVQPERAKHREQVLRENWWRFRRTSLAFYTATADRERVLAIAQVSSTVQPVLVPTGRIWSHKVMLFASDDAALLALLASSPHYWWAIRNSGTMRADLSYSPSDVFVTLALPELSERMRAAGEALHADRSGFMLNRQLGLTKTYNLVHDPAVTDAEVAHLRALHVEIDEATCAAYGWSDLDLRHAHYETRQGVRWTVHPEVQTELADRLLELNHKRHAVEVAAGLHDKKGAKKPIKAPAAKSDEPKLFGDDA